MICAKVHRNPDGQMILALCDQELLGKKFEQGSRQLDLTTGFYHGEEATEDEIKELIKEVYIINLVGEQSLNLMKKLKLTDEKHVIRIQNIPHTQVLLVRE